MNGSRCNKINLDGFEFLIVEYMQVKINVTNILGHRQDTCGVPLIDGLGQEYVFTHGLHASSLRRVWHGLATQVNSMRESICALRWASKVHRASGSGLGKPSAIMHIGFFAYFYRISLECSRFLSNVVVSGKSPFYFRDSLSFEAVGVARWPPCSL